MPLSFHRKIAVLGQVPFIDFLNGIDGVDWWHMQETSGAVALATNSALALGRELLVKDFTAGLWAATAGDAIDDADSFTTVDSGGVRVNDPSFTAGRTYTARIKGTTTTGTLELKDFASANLYKTIVVGGGAFDETFDFTAVGDGVFFRHVTTGTTDIDWPNTTIKQTDIAAWSEFPGADVIVNGEFAADTNWTKGDAAVTIASNKATWSGAQGGNADLTAAVAPLASGIRYLITYTLSGVSAGTITPLFGTQTGTAQNASGTFTEEVTANGTAFVLRGNAAFTGSCEVVSVQPANPMNADNTAAAVGQAADGNLVLGYAFDGATSFLNNYSVELNSKFDPDAGTVIVPIKVSGAGVWEDSSFRLFFNVGADGDNFVALLRTSSNNQLSFRYKAGGTQESINIATSSIAYLLCIATWDTSADGGNGEFKAYLNGVKSGATLAIDGTWVGNLLSTSTIIGAASTTPNQVWDGDISHVGIANRALSATEILDIWDRSGLS